MTVTIRRVARSAGEASGVSTAGGRPAPHHKAAKKKVRRPASIQQIDAAMHAAVGRGELTDAQAEALRLLCDPGDGVAGPALALRQGGAQAIHRAVSRHLGRIDCKEHLDTTPLIELRAIARGSSEPLHPADARALERFGEAFPDSNVSMLLLGARLLADSIDRWTQNRAGS